MYPSLTPYKYHNLLNNFYKDDEQTTCCINFLVTNLTRCHFYMQFLRSLIYRSWAISRGIVLPNVAAEKMDHFYLYRADIKECDKTHYIITTFSPWTLVLRLDIILYRFRNCVINLKRKTSRSHALLRSFRTKRKRCFQVHALFIGLSRVKKSNSNSPVCLIGNMFFFKL